MPEVKQLRSTVELDAILSESNSRPVLLFKHSTSCPVSARAHRAWDAFLETEEAKAVTLALVRVIEERPVSLAIAERVGIEHQSPQAMLLRNGRAVWQESHRSITLEALQSAASQQEQS